MKPCVFINLPSATARRQSLEASFAAAAPQGWALSRFEALGPADVATIPGSISPAEKACFASHRAAIGAHLADDQPLFVAEDDALFSDRAFSLVDAVFDHGGDWDILFTETVTSDLALMVRLAKRWDTMVAKGQFEVVNLMGRPFFAASAYAVRGAAKAKVHALLSAAPSLDTAYDIYLRELCHSGQLKAGVCFPFVTTVGGEAEVSQIQDSTGVIDLTLNAWRRLMYVRRDVERSRREIAHLEATYCDDVSRMVGGIFAAIVSPAFPSDS